MNNKKRFSIITIAIIVLVVCIVIFICAKMFVFNKNKEDTINDKTVEITNISGEENVEYDGNKKINISDYMQDEIYLEDFTFNNFYIYSVDNVTRIEFDVCNESSSRKKMTDYKIKIFKQDKNVGEIICTGEEFAAGQTKRLSVVIGADVANLTTIGIEQIYNVNF